MLSDKVSAELCPDPTLACTYCIWRHHIRRQNRQALMQQLEEEAINTTFGQALAISAHHSGLSLKPLKSAVS